MSVLGFTLARISGVSMEPMLTDGSVALFRRPLFRACQAERGDIVLVDHPDFGVIVKRVRSVGADGAVALEGTSPASTPASMLGSVNSERLRGVLVKAWSV